MTWHRRPRPRCDQNRYSWRCIRCGWTTGPDDDRSKTVAAATLHKNRAEHPSLWKGRT